MDKQGQLFLGVTAKEFRDYTHMLLSKMKGNYKNFIIPCAGTFTLAKCAIDCGWPRENIVTSDISLYSSVIGYYITGQSVEDLGIKIDVSGKGKYTTFKNPVMILYYLKLFSLPKKNAYQRNIYIETLRHKEKYLKLITAQLKTMKQNLEGITYTQKDLWQELQEGINSEENFFYIDLPTIRKGYDKMFDTHGKIKWEAPECTELLPGDDKKICEYFDGAKSLMMIKVGVKGEPYNAGWEVFGYEKKANDNRYYVSNKPEKINKVINNIAVPVKKTEIMKSEYPMFNQQDRITNNSKITFVTITQNEALYYRDLFAHKLGVTKAELYLAMIIDGKIVSVSGFHLRDWIVKRENWVFEVFGFSVRPELYPRINKLHMMCLTCEETKSLIKNQCKNVHHDFTRFHTVCLTTHHEQKGNRGVLELVSREEMKDGRFKIKYQTDFKPWGWKQAKLLWLQKEKYNVKTGEK